MSFNYEDLIHLCNYSIDSHSNRSFLFFPYKLNIEKPLKQFKKHNYHNVFIIDCAEYYNDSDIVPILTTIINKKCNNVNVNTYFIEKNNERINVKNKLSSKNLIFLLNTHTFEESSKNIIQFINTLPSHSENDNFHIFFVFNSCLGNEIKNSVSKVINQETLTFKNYSSFIKHKNNIFPFNKMKITKRKSREYLPNILFIGSLNNDYLYTQTHDYKSIIIDFLTNESFDYSSIFSISHYENIPLILYENCNLILNDNRKNIDKNKNNIIINKIKNEIRQLCIDYYSYTNNPDFSLFEKSNLYYFLYKFKKLVNSHNEGICKAKLNNISFTKYYSNRASEIQYQKTIDSYSFV